jgi:hypothetical protein
MAEDPCPVCQITLTAHAPKVNFGDSFDCPRCGEFTLSGTVTAILVTELAKGLHRRALMSHKIRRMQRPKQRPFIDSNIMESFWVEDALPSPSRQADDLILWLGDNQIAYETPQRAPLHFLSAWIGASLQNPKNPFAGIHWLLTYLDTQSQDLKAGGSSDDPNVMLLHLTMQGWNKYAELKERRVESRTAFMAMQFRETELANVVEQCFKKAVARTGFELRLLTDGQQAGSIDNQIRARLLSARFVIADLSHGNHGAYWESGFAEGLNRPVIYTCDKLVWEVQKTHFDTNHMLHVLWDTTNLKKTEDELAATIRATLRGEAIQADD